MEFHTLANGGPGQGHRQQPSMTEVVHVFLSNTKLRFGEDSLEVTTILDILKTFQQGNMSKRDTLLAIIHTLGAHDDLKQDLMNVLFHAEADWGTGDFEFGETSAQSCLPQFLEPVYQPQMRLPSISSSWYPTHQPFHTLEHTVLSSYNGTHGPGQPTSPRMQENANPFQIPNPFTSPAFVDSAKYVPYVGETSEVEGSPAEYGWGRNYQSDRDIANYDHFWKSAESHPVLEHAPLLPSTHHHLTPTSDSCIPLHTSPENEDLITNNPYLLGDPVAVPLGQPVDNMSPPSKKRRRKAPTAHVEAEETQAKAQGHEAPHVAAVLEGVPSRQPKDTTEEGQTKVEATRTFIHSLCGKGFSSRSRVKKHHWGAKIDDLETTSGCWAKHKKPNVSWNEHPSCKEGAPAPRAAKKPTRPVLKLAKSEEKASKATTALKTHDKTTGTSTLRDLPQAVADAVSPSNAIQHGLEHASPYHTHKHPIGENFGSPRNANSFAPEDSGSYHSHRLPSRSSFDSLLTAVNVASMIEAPKPQARHDSVAYHLDSQAIAAERNRQNVSSWRDASYGREEEMFAYGHYYPNAAHGLGITYPQRETYMLSQMEDHACSPSTGTPTDPGWDSHRVSLVSGSKHDDATVPSVSLGPNAKRRKN